MSKSKIIKYLSIILLISIFLLIAAFSFFKIVDFDTMHKLASGRLIAESGIVRDCPFNYTKEDCQPMFMVQWLFHLFIFLIYNLTGWAGLVGLQSLIILAIFMAIFIYQRQAGFSLISSSVLLLIGSLVATERFMLRADLLAILMLVLFFIFLQKYENSHKKYPLFILLGLQIIWANIHGSFPLAFCLILALLTAHIVKNLWTLIYLKKRASLLTQPIEKLALLFILTVAVSFINPYGSASFFGTFHFLIDYEPMFSRIREFRGVFEPWNFPYLTVQLFKLLAAGTVLIIIANLKKIRLKDLFVLAGFLYLGVTSIRNIALFAVLAAMILPFYLDNIIFFLRQKLADKKTWLLFSRVGLIITLIALIAYSHWMILQVVSNRLYLQEQQLRRFGWGVSEISYPFGATEFIRQHNLPGNMFNNFSLGGFLHWELFPERKTFIDNHTWTMEWYDYYLQITQGMASLDRLIEKYNINYFILTHYTEDTLRLTRTLYLDPLWLPIYFDEVAVIFIKAVPDNLDLITNLAINLEEEGYNPAVIALEEPINFSWGYTNRGIFMANLGLVDQAIFQYQKAVETDESNYSAYNNLGLIYYHQQDYQRAEQAFLQAINIKSNFAPVNYNLAMLYFKTERYDQALESYKKTLRINPAYRLANYHLGLIYEQKADLARAKKHYQRELQISPNLPEAQNALNRVVARQTSHREGQQLASIENLLKQIENNPDNADLHFQLAIAYGLEEKHDLALEYLQKTIELDPNHAIARFNLANIYSLRGLHQQARDEYLAVADIDPEFADAYLNLGVYYRYFEQDNEKALENWQKFIELAPNDPQAVGIKQEIAKILKEEMN